MLDFKSESLSSLRGRYNKALEYTFNSEEIFLRDKIRPGELRSNVFDSKEGIRLIISKEINENGTTYIHISSSLMKGTTYLKLKDCKSPKKAQKEFKKLSIRLFRGISGFKNNIDFICWDGHIPHWKIEIEA